jgi:predicted dehydrogenase
LSKIRTAVIGAGSFGRNHVRVCRQMEQADLVAIVDTDPNRAGDAAAQTGCAAFTDVTELNGKVDAAIVATPTSTHAEIACPLLDAGIDVLVEKPIAPNLEQARRITDAAAAGGRIVQVGHLERFNPAVQALRRLVTLPLFFEIHRLSLFSPRSLDVDVVLDLMIHDIDIVLSLTGRMPDEIRAAGISILSSKVDIANVRLAFPGGCIANLTASRVSTERVRKIRLFQPSQYISVDYGRQDVLAFSVRGDQEIGFDPVNVEKKEPLKLELESFFEAVATRRSPEVTGEDSIRALEVALGVLDRIEEHSRIVAESINQAK